MAEVFKHPILGALDRSLPKAILPHGAFRTTHSVLGTGVTGSIISAEYGDIECAAKPIRIDRIPTAEKEVETLIAEFSKLYALKHANIVEFVGLCVPPVRRENDRTIWMLTKRADRSLRDCLKKGVCAKWTTQQRLLFLRDLLSGIEYMHREGVAHLDLKPENILVNIDEVTGKITPLITDFGLSRFAPSGETVMSVLAGAGTPFYMPREQAMKGKRVTVAVDVYTFGLIAVELLTGAHPLIALSNGRIERARALVMSGAEIPFDLSSICVDAASLEDTDWDRTDMEQLLQLCLSAEAMKRPSSASLHRSFDCFSGFIRDSELEHLRASRAYLRSVVSHLRETKSDSLNRAKASLYDAARCYIYGRGDYVKDVRTGAELLKQAAEMGHPRAMFEWGLCLREGLYFVKKDDDPGQALIVRAADAGDELATAHCHILGWGAFERDMNRSFPILQSLDESDPWVMYCVGVAYRGGFGVEQNRTTAAQWYQRAADAGHVLGQYMLGNCYQNGHGVLLNEQRAFELYKLAADQGNASGTYWVGVCYEKEEGVAKDVNKAIQYYKLAHAQGKYCSVELKRLGVPV